MCFPIASFFPGTCPVSAFYRQDFPVIMTVNMTSVKNHAQEV